MSRKRRTLAGFDEVADQEPEIINDNNDANDNINDDVNDNKNVNDDVNDEVNNNINNYNNEQQKPVEESPAAIRDDKFDFEADRSDQDDEGDVLDEILGKPKKKPASQLKGFYLEADVIKVLEKLTEKSGNKKIGSKIVNQALRKMFKEKGLL